MNDNEQRDRQQLSAASGRSGPSVGLIALAVVVAVIGVFFLRNSDRTKLDFLFLNWQTTVRWSIFVAIILGMLLDRVLLFAWRRWRKTGSK
jgi:uncharacterized integral membrane protein